MVTSGKVMQGHGFMFLTVSITFIRNTNKCTFGT